MVLRKVIGGISEVLFPKVCTVCGLKLSDAEHFVCVQCLNSKFEEPLRTKNRSSSDVLLPEGIALQHALWNFDKGGHLQELLHQLKYHRLTGVGEDIGRQLGKSLIGDSMFTSIIDGEKVRLVPVPLHSNKRRTRGYNQAFYIAKGVAEVTNLPIIKKEAVIRRKNTKTQTGFSLEKRQENISEAFNVTAQDAFDNILAIIIDDVFTTGATTFELAAELMNAGCRKIIIATVAQA